MRQLTILLLTLVLCPAAFAKLYKWVDADGKVFYSDRKSSDNKAEEVSLRGLTPVSKEEAQQRLDELKSNADGPRKERQFKQSMAAEDAEHRRRLAENCEIYRRNLTALQNAARVNASDGSFLDDKARAVEVARAQKEIKDKCK